MGKIANYSVVTPKGDDKILISETSGLPQNVTKNITVDGIVDYTVSNLPTSLTIPVPELYQLKLSTGGGLTYGNSSRIGINGLLGSNKDWILNNPSARLFLQLYRPQGRNIEMSGPSRNGGWTHPPHLNGTYTTSKFGNTNWGRGKIVARSLDGSSADFTVHPLVTEWSIQNDLVLAANGSAVDFSDPLLFDTARIQVPMNNLQFLANRYTPHNTTSTEITSIPFPNGLVIEDNPQNIFIAPVLSVKNVQATFGWNTRDPQFVGAIPMMKVVFRMVIGIENPDFTLTNHTIPYIFGQPSNPMTLSYARSPLDSSILRQVILTPGQSTNVPRSSSFF